MKVPKERFRILEQLKTYKIVAVGKKKRRLSKKRNQEIKNFVDFLEKSFNQSIYSVYINENNTDEKKLHNIAFLFSDGGKK